MAPDRDSDDRSEGGIVLAEPSAALLTLAPTPQLVETYSLAELQQQFGPLDPDYREVFFENVKREELISLGHVIATERILADAPGFFGSAWRIYQSLPEQRLDILIGFSPEYLAIGVAETLQLQSINASYDAVARNSRRLQTQKANQLRELIHQGVAYRDGVLAVLARFVSQELLTKDQFRDIRTNIESADKVVVSLQEVAKLIRAAYSMQSPKGKRLMEVSKITEPCARGLEVRAQQIGALNETTQARTGQTAISQKELDYQEGRVLFVMTFVYGIFRRAQAIDSSIVLPRVNQLARLFRPSRPAGQNGKKKPAPPNNTGTQAAGNGQAPAATSTAAAPAAANPQTPSNAQAPAAAVAAPAQAPAASSQTPPAAAQAQPPAAAPAQTGSTTKTKKTKGKKKKAKAAAATTGQAQAPQTPAAPAAPPTPSQAPAAPQPPVQVQNAQASVPAPAPQPALSLVTAAVPSLTIPLARATGQSDSE